MKLHRRNSWRARNFSLVAIAVCTIAIVGSLLANFLLEPERLAQKEMQKIATDYYENYFYPDFIANNTGDSATADLELAFSAYTEKGFPEVRLRQLLLHNGGKNSASKAYLDAPHYTCDENATSVVYTPRAPYGPKDYTTTYNYSCQKR